MNTMKAMAAAALWVCTLGAAGLLAHVTSPPNWIVLVGCAIAPPFIIIRYWNYPRETMSESI